MKNQKVIPSPNINPNQTRRLNSAKVVKFLNVVDISPEKSNFNKQTLLAKVDSPWGLLGHINIKTEADAETIHNIKKWLWISANGQKKMALTCAPTKAHNYQPNIKLKLKFLEINNRNQSNELIGGSLYADEELPKLAQNEYYFNDLVGLNVVNIKGEVLGKVTEVTDNGAHEIISVLQKEKEDPNCKSLIYLIPFVKKYINKVEINNNQIVVDWELDWFN